MAAITTSAPAPARPRPGRKPFTWFPTLDASPEMNLKIEPGFAPAVAVDANPATRRLITGTELYAREVVRRLPAVAPELGWTFYASRPAPGLGVDLTVLPLPRLWSQARLPIELARRRPALLLVLAHVVPAWCPVPAVTVFHDLAFERFPNAYGPRERAYLRWTTRSAAARCRALVAVSDATRRDLADFYGVDPARVSVVHPGGGETPVEPARADDERRLAGLDIEGPFALCVGRIEPRKNQLAALAAVERVPGLLLVCAGRIVDPAMGARLAASPHCRLVGHVDDAVRDLLYRRAEVLLFPSLYEGFGFPVLEALRQGLPCVLSQAGSLPEVAGEAALYADDPEGIAEAVERLRAQPELRARLAADGRRRAQSFTWERTAEGVAEVVRAAVGLPLPGPARSAPRPSTR
ncbi:MAG: glycosyltransferase family 4 protein [Chloroflexi bacterium]|nr:MAG: glycosyltransferase family 4 protein [Chloroflexota bacterium]